MPAFAADAPHPAPAHSALAGAADASPGPSPLAPRAFGDTGLTVSVLGLGAGTLGDAQLDEGHVGHLLNEALDLGITLIDTARGYGLSEERIGRHLAHRRDEFVLSTKVGYGVDNHQDWTYGCVAAGVDAALTRLATDHIDIVHLHSCPRAVLQDGAVIDALEAAREMGKIRSVAYSGDNEALDWAVASGRFASVEASINLCDQRNVDGPLRRADGLGVIAKRPVANAPWRFDQRPAGHYGEVYWDRWRAMAIDPHGHDWHALALRFTLSLPGVHSCIVGTTNLDHLRHNASIAAEGPLPAHLVDHLRQAFHHADDGWTGQT
ncbi:MAG: aldo/keto reductase [Acidobacteriota bacterium]